MLVIPKMLGQVTEQLKHTQGITYFSPLAGRFDLAIELKAADQKQTYVIEPVSVKEQVIKSATECTGMIRRIDDVIAGGRKGHSPQGGPGGKGDIHIAQFRGNFTEWRRAKLVPCSL